MRRFVAVWFVFCVFFGLMTAFPLSTCAEMPEEALPLEEDIPWQSEDRYAEVITEKGLLNMRASPDDKADVMERLSKGTIVQVLEDQGTWTRILYASGVGYVKTEFLVEVAHAPSDQGGVQTEGPAPADVAQGALSNRYAMVATQQGTLNMRYRPQENAEVVKKIPQAAIVRILEDHGDWSKVLYKGESGFVKANMVIEVVELAYSPITVDSDGQAILAFKRALHKLEYLKSEDINQRFDATMERALLKVQLMNDVPLTPGVVTPELQALMEWGMIAKAKSGYVETETDESSGLTVGVYCWDSGGMLYDEDKAVRLDISFAAKATGGQAPYTVTVKKSMGGEASGDVVTSPFPHIWGQDSEVLYVYATAVDAAGNSVTACTPFRYVIPDRWVEKK